MIRHELARGLMMRRKVRNKTYREQQLQRAALAAGASFGWQEGPNPVASTASRHTGYFLPAMLLTPVLTSAAWYLTG